MEIVEVGKDGVTGFWRFSTDHGGVGTLMTELIAYDNIIKVKQTKHWLSFGGDAEAMVDINKITSIYAKNAINWFMVMFKIVGVMLLFTNEMLYGFLGIGLGLYFLRDKNMIIEHSQGRVKFKGDKLDKERIEDFFNYVRKYNPDCIKVFIE